MTLRETISSLLANGGEGSDPSAALAEAGFGDVAPEAFGTALVHFSDTSSLPEADALAPITTRMSAVPFEETDLPATEHEAPDDAFALFQAVDPDPSAFVNVEDVDLPADFDAAMDGAPAGDTSLDEAPVDDAVDAALTGADDLDDGLDGGFGVGEGEVDQALDTAADLAASPLDDVALDSTTPVIDEEPFDDGFDAAFGDSALDDAVDTSGDLFSVDFSDGDDPEADPLDLDLDFD